MKHLYILILLILSFTHTSVSAQNFKGKITDKSGEPLYGSSIYIKEVNQGLVCNDDGFYQTNLPAGSYNVEYKCLGFKKRGTENTNKRQRNANLGHHAGRKPIYTERSHCLQQ